MTLVKPSNRKAIREIGEATSCHIKTSAPKTPESSSFHCPDGNEQRSTETVGLWVVCLDADQTLQHAKVLLSQLLKVSALQPGCCA